MAVDTKGKRARSLQAGRVPGVTLPPPDGTISAADRAHMGSGFTLGGESTPPTETRPGFRMFGEGGCFTYVKT